MSSIAIGDLQQHEQSRKQVERRKCGLRRLRRMLSTGAPEMILFLIFLSSRSTVRAVQERLGQVSFGRFVLYLTFDGETDFRCTTGFSQVAKIAGEYCLSQAAEQLCRLDPMSVEISGTVCHEGFDRAIDFSGGLMEFAKGAAPPDKDQVSECVRNAFISEICVQSLKGQLPTLSAFHVSVPSTPKPTSSPTDKPTETPSAQPTTAKPSTQPSDNPTPRPFIQTSAPTPRPTHVSTKSPASLGNMPIPTKLPTKYPSEAPTKAPVKAPTKAPTESLPAGSTHNKEDPVQISGILPSFAPTKGGLSVAKDGSGKEKLSETGFDWPPTKEPSGTQFSVITAGEDEQSKGDNNGALIGGIIAALVMVTALAIGFLVKRRKQEKAVWREESTRNCSWEDGVDVDEQYQKEKHSATTFVEPDYASSDAGSSRVGRLLASASAVAVAMLPGRAKEEEKNFDDDGTPTQVCLSVEDDILSVSFTDDTDSGETHINSVPRAESFEETRRKNFGMLKKDMMGSDEDLPIFRKRSPLAPALKPVRCVVPDESFDRFMNSSDASSSFQTSNESLNFEPDQAWNPDDNSITSADQQTETFQTTTVHTRGQTLGQNGGSSSMQSLYQPWASYMFGLRTPPQAKEDRQRASRVVTP